MARQQVFAAEDVDMPDGCDWLLVDSQGRARMFIRASVVRSLAADLDSVRDDAPVGAACC